MSQSQLAGSTLLVVAVLAMSVNSYANDVTKYSIVAESTTVWFKEPVATSIKAQEMVDAERRYREQEQRRKNMLSLAGLAVVYYLFIDKPDKRSNFWQAESTFAPSVSFDGYGTIMIEGKYRFR